MREDSLKVEEKGTNRRRSKRGVDAEDREREKMEDNLVDGELEKLSLRWNNKILIKIISLWNYSLLREKSHKNLFEKKKSLESNLSSEVD